MELDVDEVWLEELVVEVFELTPSRDDRLRSPVELEDEDVFDADDVEVVDAVFEDCEEELVDVWEAVVFESLLVVVASFSAKFSNARRPTSLCGALAATL